MYLYSQNTDVPLSDGNTVTKLLVVDKVCITSCVHICTITSYIIFKDTPSFLLTGQSANGGSWCNQRTQTHCGESLPHLRSTFISYK